jgi:hypothetical protein
VIDAASGQGSVLIAIGGQPPKAFQLGQKVDDDWTLTALTPRQAKLNSPAGGVMLELPSPPRSTITFCCFLEFRVTTDEINVLKNTFEEHNRLVGNFSS